jgi:hypothetical protein
VIGYECACDNPQQAEMMKKQSKNVCLGGNKQILNELAELKIEQKV